MYLALAASPRDFCYLDFRPMGLGQTGAKISAAGGQVAGAFAPTIATTLGIAVPVVGAAIAGITIALTALFSRKGPRQKVAATSIADQAAKILGDNVQAYLAGPRTLANQKAAVDNFYYAWNQVLEQCGDPALGDPGRRCISERERGGWAPWCPTGTGCDWFIQYLDPIEKDALAGRDEPSFSVAELFGGGGAPGQPASFPAWLPWAAAAAVLAVVAS